MKKILPVALLLLLPASCRWWDGGVNPPPIGPGIFPIRVSSTYNFPLYGLSLTFLRTTEDSRCPEVCIWEGVANIEMRAHLRSGNSADFSLSISGFVTARSGRHMFKDTLGFRFTLMQLDPYPSYGVPQDSTKYVAHMKVERLR